MGSNPVSQTPSPFASPFGSPTFREPSGRIVAQIGYQATLYFEHGTSTSVRQGIGTCLDLFELVSRPHLRWMTNPTGDRWEEFDTARADAFRKRLNYPTDANWEMHWHAGQRLEDASEFQFEVYACAPESGTFSYLRFALPLGDPMLTPKPFSNLVGQCCDALKPAHGYGGFTFLESQDLAVRSKTQPLICSLARRFPGIDVDRPPVHLLHVANGIKGVNWLTFLGARWLNSAGGRAVLRAALPDAFVFQDCGDGLLIQAGPRPQIGDRNQKLWITLYPELSRLLKPIRIRNHRPLDFYGPNRFDEERTEEWLARFDRDPW